MRPEIEREWIAGLTSCDAEERARAAAEIYRAGRERAEAATQAWWKNAEFVQLCGGTPVVTVGVAVRPETFARIREADGMPRLAVVPPEQDAIEFELHFPSKSEGGVALDVLTTSTLSGNGAIARFLARQGEGIQQVELRVSDVDRATTLLRSEFGVEPVYPAKRPGADGTCVNFFLVAGLDGKRVLIELYEAGEPRTRRPDEFN